ncbi:MAG: long-chain fatty acid--CoA ligase [Clostridiales bacterium]|nr:long-chain fatty acid--CoA ligase [Clostridiales bacterium]
MKSSKVKTPWYDFYDGVKPHLEYPDISIYNMLEDSMKNREDYISYNYYGTKKTYKEFIAQIDKCARALKSLGIKATERVSICMPNTPEAIIAFYAINKIGAVANMIHPLSAENEIKYFLNISKSKYVIAIDIAFNKINHIANDTNLKKCIVVSAKNSMPMYLKIGYQLTKGRKIKLEKSDLNLSWNDFIKLGENYNKKIKSDFKGNNVAAILYSGGTTGYPKGIELTNLNFNALAIQSFEACQCLKEKDKVLSIMPVFHGFGLGICIHTVQYFGGTSILLPQFSAKTFDKLLKKYKPNIIAGVPTLYEALLKNKNLDGYDLSFLKCVISGGDSLSISLKEKVDTFLKEHGANIQIREGYGLTECVTGSCLTPMNYYRKGSIGIPYPDTYYKIVKPNTEEELPFGEEGEILISGPSVMKGYLDDEKETKLTLRKHKDGLTWMYTGDLGYMDKDGFIYFKQRLKRIIISSGYCLYPQYIENIIDSHPKVLMSCVIGIDHPYKVQVAKAFIVLRNGYTADDELLKEIKEHCEKNLARYSWPTEYEFRSELPKTLVGKIAYSKLEEEERGKNENK